jgi:succinate-acetate transporter protein
MALYEADRAEPAARPAVANPAPLGLSAFALTTFVLSSANAGLIPGADAAKMVVGLALFYGGIAQLLAGMWEFRAGNTFGAVAFTSYGAFWLAVGYSVQNALIPNSTAFGYFLLGWTIFTVLMFLATLRTDGALIGVFGFLTLTFLFLTIGAFGGGSAFNTIGGILGIITAALAWYRAIAVTLASHTSAFNLPIFPM